MEKAAQRRHLIGTPIADEILFSLPGYCQMLAKAIRKGRPEFTEEEAKELRMHMSLADVYALNDRTGIGLVAHDPKKSPSTSAGNGSSTSRNRRRRASTGGNSSTKR